MRRIVHRTLAIGTAAAAGVAVLGATGTAQAAIKPSATVSCTSKQGDRGTLYFYKTDLYGYKATYKIKLKGHGTRTANDVEFSDDGLITGTEKHVTRKARSDNKVHTLFDQTYTRTRGYIKVKFIFDIPKVKDHWCTTKKKWI
ncbi:hypothetical protein GCM10009678_40830 [Actinomadura kijaniata]|uniref:Uncharacterized protein n=1 Tax=Actinomadura namibiensis TaxID=182080 RepID=A0A7W3QKN2_ACTNM|nr:hypothetical protein [Actinomadura namibiensis]MBA8950607.1 hypothetical protein [Actinomadura namibiensis]